MKKLLCLFVFTCLLSPGALGQDLSSRFDPAKMKARVIRLSSDEFRGRAPGDPGGRLATQYIADEMKAAGVRPANNGRYFQNVTMIGVKADPNTVLKVGGETLKF